MLKSAVCCCVLAGGGEGLLLGGDVLVVLVVLRVGRGPWVGVGGGAGAAVVVQQGPVHLGLFFLALRFGSWLQRMCSQSPQLVHCTAYEPSFTLQTGQK